MVQIVTSLEQTNFPDESIFNVCSLVHSFSKTIYAWSISHEGIQYVQSLWFRLGNYQSELDINLGSGMKRWYNYESNKIMRSIQSLELLGSY